jgi:hypothetical protein
MSAACNAAARGAFVLAAASLGPTQERSPQ